jgi:hypothetical protein
MSYHKNKIFKKMDFIPGFLFRLFVMTLLLVCSIELLVLKNEEFANYKLWGLKILGVVMFFLSISIFNSTSIKNIKTEKYEKWSIALMVILASLFFILLDRTIEFFFNIF